MANPKDGVSIFVKKNTKELIKKESKNTGYPMQVIVDIAIREYIDKRS